MRVTRKVVDRKHIGRTAALLSPFEFQLHDFHIHLHEGKCVLLWICCACLLLLYIPASTKELTAWKSRLSLLLNEGGSLKMWPKGILNTKTNKANKILLKKPELEVHLKSLTQKQICLGNFQISNYRGVWMKWNHVSSRFILINNFQKSKFR